MLCVVLVAAMASLISALCHSELCVGLAESMPYLLMAMDCCYLVCKPALLMQIKRQAQRKDLALSFLGPKDHIQSDLHAYQVQIMPSEDFCITYILSDLLPVSCRSCQITDFCIACGLSGLHSHQVQIMPAC